MVHAICWGVSRRSRGLLHTLFITASIATGCGTTQVQSPTPVAKTAESTPVVVIEAGVQEALPPVVPDELADSNEVIAPIAKLGPQPGQYAPRIVAEFISGIGPTTIEEARGKVILIDFWATFCAPCMHSFPKYQALVDQFGGNLVVIAISVDDPDTNRVQIDDFIQATGVRFSVVRDKEQETARAYRLPKMPSSFIVDQTGIIRHIHGGYSRDTIEDMSRQIKALLAK
jgi:cytochrome c biogenesis protein CcmG, thiol:disulfide interchange protein DsbE